MLKSCFAARLSVAVAILALTSSNISSADEQKTPEGAKKNKVTYADHVRPILEARCFACHNQNKKSSDLDLTNYTNLMQGGAAGSSIEAGDPDSSYLWSLVNHDDTPYMPPKSDKLPAKELAIIKAWIEGGAPENAGSKVVIKKKPKIQAVTEAPGERPAVVPLPGRVGMQSVVKTELKTAVTALATSPWAPVTAVAGQRQVILYNTQSLEPIGILPYPEGIPHVLKFSRNGSLLMAAGGKGSAKGRVVVWDIKTGERLFEVGEELDTILAADISADHSMIVVGGPSRIVRVYSTQDGSMLYEFKKHTEWVCSAEFSPDGILLATGDRNGGLFVLEAETGREYLTLNGHSKCVTAVSWRSDSNILASCSEDTTVRLWEMENGRQIKSWGAHGGGVASVEFARDGRLTTCGRDRTTKLWKQDGGALQTFDAFADLALEVTFCDESNRVISGDWTGMIRVWQAADKKLVGELSSNPPKLEERLAAAQAALTTVTNAQKQADASYKALAAAVTKINADLAANKKTSADQTKVAQTTQTTINNTKSAIAQLTAQQQAAAKQVAALDPVVALLKVTLDKGNETAGKAAGDKEIAAAVAGLKAVFDKRNATLATAKKTVTDKTTAITTAKKTLATAETQYAAAKAAVDAAKKKVAELTPMVKPATDKAAAAKTALDTSNQQLQAAQAQVKRWQEEIALLTKLNELKAKRAELEKISEAEAVAQAEFNEKKAAFDVVAQAATQAKAASDGANAALAQAKQASAAATAALQGVQKEVARLEAIIPALKDATDKAQAASAKLPNDKDLATATGQVKAVYDKNVAALTNAKKDVTVKTTAVEAAKKIEADAATKATAATTALAATTKKMDEGKAALKPFEDKLAAAQKATAAATEAVNKAQADVTNFGKSAAAT